MKKMAWAWGVTLGLAGAAGMVQVVGCSSDSTDTDGGTGKDSGKDTGSSDTGPAGDSGNPGDSAPSDSGCAAIKLFPNPDAGAYCPFQAGPDGSTFGNCGTAQHCCQYGVSANLPSTCSNANANCQTPDASGNYDWKCNEKDDCNQNQVCCLLANVVVEDKFCSGQAFTTGVTGSTCKASCATLADGGIGNEVQMCSGNGDCTGGKVCMPFKKGGGSYGVCL
jgi:hypothetical protein